MKVQPHTVTIVYAVTGRPGAPAADAEHGGAMTRPQTTTAYDKDGNAISITDARGIVTQTQYDELNPARIITTTPTPPAQPIGW